MENIDIDFLFLLNVFGKSLKLKCINEFNKNFEFGSLLCKDF